MALVTFYRGVKDDYSACKMRDGIYFSEDTNEIFLNGRAYGRYEDAIPKTCGQLRELRDRRELQPGQLYRITDYEATVSVPNARSAGNRFDLVVMALSPSEISERALAANHDFLADISCGTDCGCKTESEAADRTNYFSGSDLSAWQVWYSLDDDRDRFDWALKKEAVETSEEPVSGKGVIYRLIDEWGNDCPYDFKGIQFKRSVSDLNKLALMRFGGTEDLWLYTFSDVAKGEKNVQDDITDASLARKVNDPLKTYSQECDSNVMLPMTYTETVGETKNVIRHLNDIVVVRFNIRLARDNNQQYRQARGNTWDADCTNMTFMARLTGNKFGPFSRNFKGYHIDSCSFGAYNTDITLTSDAKYCETGRDCHDVTFLKGAIHATVGDGVKNSKIGGENNSIGAGCDDVNTGTGSNITVGPGCVKVGIGASNRNITVGAGSSDVVTDSSCEDITVGAGGKSIKFKSKSSGNAVGEQASEVELGTGSTGNRVGPHTSKIKLRGNTADNTVGAGSSEVTLGDGNEDNVIGNGTKNVVFNNRCWGNTIGNRAENITLGDDCGNNSIGARSGVIELKEVCKANVLGPRCSRITLEKYSAMLTLLPGSAIYPEPKEEESE